MKFFQKINYVNKLKNEYIKLHETNNKLIENEKLTSECLALRISYHFENYNMDIQNFENSNVMCDCADALKSLVFHLKYYKNDEKAIKEEHANLLNIISKKEENYNRYLEVTKELQFFNQTKFLANFYIKNKNFLHIDKSRDLCKKADIDRHDNKDYIKLAIYSKTLSVEQIDYDYLAKAKNKFQEIRSKFFAINEQNFEKERLKENILEN